jgi:hypothetical protein
MSKSDLKSATSENRAAVQSSIKTRQESTLSRAKDRQQKTRDVTSRFNNSNISPSYRSNFSTYSTHVHTYYHDPITSNPYYWMYLSQLNQRHETQTLVLNGSTGETYEANAKALEKIELEMSNLDVSVEKFFGVVERMDGIHEALAGYPEDTKLIDSATAAVHQAQAHLDEAKAAADQNNGDEPGDRLGRARLEARGGRLEPALVECVRFECGQRCNWTCWGCRSGWCRFCCECPNQFKTKQIEA